MNEILFVAAQDTDAAVETASPQLAAGEILLGTLTAVARDGTAHVSFAGMNSETAIAALSTVSLSQQHIGRQVALLFAGGDFRKPVIIGVIHSPLNDMLESFSLLQDIEVSAENASDTDPFDGRKLVEIEKPAALDALRVDGKQVVIEGEEEIVLRCGESSITLTKAGKILIRGKYLVSRSSGVNRILGGSVQVN